jgi:FtsZ-binding cell division protein ZapB
MEQSPNNNSKIAIIVLSLLTAVLGVLYFRSNQTSTDQAAQIEQKVTEIANTRSSLDSISTQLDAKIAEIKSLGGQVADLEALKVQLEQDKASLKSSNRATIASYEAKIKEYNAVLTTKDGEIVELKKQNGILTENNQTLTTQNTTLNTENSGLKNQNQTLSDTLSSVSQRNKELARKVSIGAALKAQNLKVLAVNAKGKETERTRLNGKKIEKLKVLFSLATNPITKLESKTVYVRVIDGEGATLSNEAMGSGRISINGKEVAFTAKQTFEYTNDGQTVAVTYPRGGVAYKPGKYSVELYAEGFQIGTGAFEVK